MPPALSCGSSQTRYIVYSLCVVQIKYDVDQSDDRMYLLLAFTHFGASAPTAGSRGAAVALQFLPDMSRVRVQLVTTWPSLFQCRKGEKMQGGVARRCCPGVRCTSWPTWGGWSHDRRWSARREHWHLVALGPRSCVPGISGMCVQHVHREGPRERRVWLRGAATRGLPWVCTRCRMVSVQFGAKSERNSRCGVMLIQVPSLPCLVTGAPAGHVSVVPRQA